MKKNNFARNAEIGQKGLTLIEVMVAMVILGVGIMAIVALQARNMNYNSNSKRRTQAYTWAANRVERLLALPYTSPELSVKGTTAKVGDGHAPSAADAATMKPYVMEWDVIDNSANIQNSREVIVWVWKSKKSQLWAIHLQQQNEGKKALKVAIARIKFVRVKSSI